MCMECGGRLVQSDIGQVCVECGLVNTIERKILSPFTQKELIPLVQPFFTSTDRIHNFYLVDYKKKRFIISQQIRSYFGLTSFFNRQTEYLFMKAYRNNILPNRNYKKPLLYTCIWISMNLVNPIFKFDEYISLLDSYGYRFSYTSYINTLQDFPNLKPYLLHENFQENKINSLFHQYYTKLESFTEYREIYMQYYEDRLSWRLFLKVLRNEFENLKQFLLDYLKYRSLKLSYLILSVFYYLIQQTNIKYGLDSIMYKKKFCAFYGVNPNKIRSEFNMKLIFSEKI